MLTFRLLYLFSCFLRLLFLSSKAGAIISNVIIYCWAKCLHSRQKSYPDYLDLTGLVALAFRGNEAVLLLQRKFLNLAPVVRKRMMFFCCMNLSGRRVRSKEGQLVPYNIYISPTYRCNLSCRNCYAAGRQGDLDIGLIEKVVKEQEKLGIYNIILTGGEPLLREDIWPLIKRYPNTVFNIFTNGILLDQDLVDGIARLGNVRPAISLDGFRERTDARRGEGVYDKAIAALKRCQQANIFYSASVMVDRTNYGEVTSDEFIQMLVDFGVYVVVFPLCMPLGNFDNSDLLPTSEQVKSLEERSEYIKSRYPILSVVARNGSDLVTDCSAACQRIHIAASGEIEPCVFCQWSAENISETDITGAMYSSFFKLIRDFNGSGETCLNACKANESVFLQTSYLMAGAHSSTNMERRQEKCGMMIS